MEFVQEEGVLVSRVTADLFPSSSSSRDVGGSGSGDEVVVVEREHMFDKVVTPSDVGKLNRLVIPKQHAEKYFPLDNNSSDKGLLLNFEDRHGKPWRFRYSYWNSSQSYVMTKGWSRFVKDKKLDAGDIVSFHRHHDRLFIDWRRRPQQQPHPAALNSHLRWGLFPPPPYAYNYHYAPHPPPYRSHHHHHHVGPPDQPVYYLRPSSFPMQQTRHVIDSVPLLHGRSTASAAGKRLRLFGVNMECDHHHHQIMTTNNNVINDQSDRATVLPSTALQYHHVSDSDKGKSSLSFDLDL